MQQKMRKLTLPIDLNTLIPDELARALAEDVMVEKILRETLSRPPAPMTTAKSIRDGKKFMAEMQLVSQATLLSRIERGEVITRDELITRLGVNRRWVAAALRSGRLFALQAPSGVDYFAAFFADASYDRRSLGRVVQVLSGLPAASIYHFFVSKSVMLGMTPLEALAEGRVNAVLGCAAGFAER
ncbi:MAG TPA: hypothetical protein VGD30_18490 [Telluria sp.]